MVEGSRDSSPGVFVSGEKIALDNVYARVYILDMTTTRETEQRPTIVELRFGAFIRYQFNVNGRLAGDYATRERAEAAIDRYMGRHEMRAQFAARMAAKS